MAAAAASAVAGRAGNRLGLGKAGMVFALARIMPGEQLLQADDVGAGRRRFADPLARALSTFGCLAAVQFICTSAIVTLAGELLGEGCVFGARE